MSSNTNRRCWSSWRGATHGTAKRITEHLSPRESRIVALGKPSDHDRKSWYFQRYVPHLPSSGEIVIFNRSWYNRAGVERVMGFCTNEEYEQFLHTVPIFEQLLVHCGVTIIKYYLDITRDEQENRLARRRDDPLRQWKISPVDEKALRHWNDYSEARNEMLMRTHSVFAPWTVVKADGKKIRAPQYHSRSFVALRISWKNWPRRISRSQSGVSLRQSSFDKWRNCALR